MKIKTICGPGGSVLLLSVQITAIVGIATACYLALYVVLNTKPLPRVSCPGGTPINAVTEKEQIASLEKIAALAKTVPDHRTLPAKTATSHGRVTGLNQDFPMLAAPRGPFVIDPAGGTINGVRYSHILGRGCYTVTGTLKGSLLVTGEAILYIPTNGLVKFDHQDVIKIAKGARLTFCNDSCADALFGRFSNDNKLATGFFYYGLAGTAGSKATFHVEKKFYGALYAPNQNLVLVGNPDRQNDFYGSVMGNTVTLLTSTK
ncbi:MAG TPA: hypothetical protein VKA67_08290 [Verrucomicrobiae bacterium]|nr:hypothetical protein [Verrucomicrobiae bacterium]